MKTIDVAIRIYGRMWHILPQTDAARRWVSKHVSEVSTYLQLPGGGFAVDWKIGEAITKDMIAAQLVLGGDP